MVARRQAAVAEPAYKAAQRDMNEQARGAVVVVSAPPANPLEVGAPLPKSIGKCADLYKEVQNLRLAMDKEVEAVKKRESEIKEHIIANLSKSDDTGAAGLRYRAQIVMKDSPRCLDWPALWAYIAKHNRFDLLQKRLGDKAVMDTLADNSIPGVEVIRVPDVSITKI